MMSALRRGGAGVRFPTLSVASPVGSQPSRAFSSTVKGEGSLAAVFGGFGFTERQLTKHEAVYREHGFDCLPVLSTIPQLISPKIAAQRGPELAAVVRATPVAAAMGVLLAHGMR